MACPSCGCKETYCANIDDTEQAYDMERCAACGALFYSMDSEEEEGYEAECYQCNGKGYNIEGRTCPYCEGSGYSDF